MNSPVEQLLRAANPVEAEHRHAQGARAQATLDRIISTPPTPAPRRGSARSRIQWIAPLTAAAALTVAVGAGHILNGQPQGGYAVTPAALQILHTPSSRDAAADLRAMAKRAAALPNDVGDGTVAQVKIKSWSLSTRVDGRQVTSQVVPMYTTTRTHEDGTTSIVQRYHYDGPHVDRFTTHNQLPYPLHGLSSRTATLATQLNIGHPAQNGTAGFFDSIVVAYRQMPIDPATRAAILRLLAAQPGVRTVGALQDRAGRHGIGFTTQSDYSGLPTRYMLIFDPTDGRLLSYEEELTSDPGKLNVHVPAVINYQIFKSARYVQ